MDSRASWFSRSPSTRRDRLVDSSHELPRWRSPSPMAASVIPPPIVQSTYMAPSRSVAAKSIVFEQPVMSDDREAQLHADLQFLLDAQADGLMKGLEGGEAGMDGASTGSTTPTAGSMRSTSARRTNKPIRRKPGLRSARKGLYSTIVALSRVKDDELAGISDSLHANEVNVAQIDAWEKKRKGLQDASSSVNADEETVRAQRLQQDADTLQASINETEIQLADMKSRHKKLTRQIAAADNAVQAKLASYTQSMKMLEADIQTFLQIQPSSSRSASRPGSSRGTQASVWQLPPKRRTIELAREQFARDRESTLRSRSRVEEEKQALDDGAKIWMDVAVTVTEFEKRLRAEMTGAAMSDSNHAWDDDIHASTPTDRLKELLAHMDGVVHKLQSKLDVAEEKNWKLLIAAIGAEVEALRQGRIILGNALGEVAPEVEPGEQDVIGAGQSGILDLPEADSGDEIRELDKSFETARRRKLSNGGGGGGAVNEDTDDEPDPELLFSRQDSETD